MPNEADTRGHFGTNTMYAPVLWAYRLGAYRLPLLVYRCTTAGWERTGKDTYQVSPEIAITLRENSVDALILREIFRGNAYARRLRDKTGGCGC